MKNLRRIRRNLDITQQELACRLGVSRATVAQWESGKNNPTVPMLPRIAKELNCTIDDLIGEKEAG